MNRTGGLSRMKGRADFFSACVRQMLESSRADYKSFGAKAVMWNQSDRNGLQRPKCFKCGTQMHLFGLTREGLGMQPGIQGNREHRCWKIVFGRIPPQCPNVPSPPSRSVPGVISLQQTDGLIDRLGAAVDNVTPGVDQFGHPCFHARADLIGSKTPSPHNEPRSAGHP